MGMKPCTDSEEVIQAFRDMDQTKVELILSMPSNIEKTKTFTKQIRKWHHFEFLLPNTLICREKYGDEEKTSQQITKTTI